MELTKAILLTGIIAAVLLSGCASQTTTNNDGDAIQGNAIEDNGSNGDTIEDTTGDAMGNDMADDSQGDTMGNDMADDSQGDAMQGDSMVKKYSLSEVAQHDNAEDCWLALHGKVYDVTAFIAGGNHGGGDAILEGCGTDATTLYETRPMGSGTPHSQTARSFLPNFEIGELAEE